MALASQMSRHDRTSVPWGSVSRRRRRRPVRTFLLLLIAGGAVGGAGWGLRNLAAGEPAEAASQETAFAESAPDPLALAPTAPIAPANASPAAGSVQSAPRQPDTAPVVLEMGRPAASAEPARDPLARPAAETVSVPAPAPVPQREPSPAASPTTAAPPPRQTTTAADRLPSDIAAIVAAAERARAENKLVEARTLLNRALLDPRTSEADRAALRQSIADLNATLVFSPTVVKGDPLTDTYTVRPGDSLAKITANLGLGVDWRLIQRINRISNPSRINVGQRLKIVRGPFHAVVDKSDFRIDLYAGEPISASAAAAPSRPNGAEPGWIYICSFRVGLGEHGTTPVGTFIVRPRSKLINPFWRNPRTGEEFAADDPRNPIGEHWLGLEGLDEATRQYEGYGIHGTIEPESIGKEMSMGCVRLAAEDVALVYEMLEEGVSIVRIVP